MPRRARRFQLVSSLYVAGILLSSLAMASSSSTSPFSMFNTNPGVVFIILFSTNIEFVKLFKIAIKNGCYIGNRILREQKLLGQPDQLKYFEFDIPIIM